MTIAKFRELERKKVSTGSGVECDYHPNELATNSYLIKHVNPQGWELLDLCSVCTLGLEYDGDNHE